MFDFSINNILASNLINFVLMVVLFISCFIVISIKNRNNKSTIEIIKEKMEDSENSKNDSYVILEQIEEKLENSKIEIDEILNRASKSAEEVIKKAEIDAEKSVLDIEKNTEKIISTELNQIKNSIKKEITLRSIQNAKEKIINKLKENPELHQKYIESAISKIGEAIL